MATRTLDAIKIEVKTAKGSHTTEVLKGKTDQKYCDFGQAVSTLLQETLEGINKIDVDLLSM